jgi:hypothetical protein
VPFKDSVFYDGREAMAVRALNIDLALLTNNVNGQARGLINGDTWLPAGIGENREGGIFYAFREDAVREDAIARPPLGTFDSYLTSWHNANARGTLGSAGIMNAGQPGRGTANNQTVWDPPVSNPGGLSPKPVDYYADPDRRPYGFRLRNGAVLARGGFNPDDAIFGLSFVSDNPVYIQGDFTCIRRRAASPWRSLPLALPSEQTVFTATSTGGGDPDPMKTGKTGALPGRRRIFGGPATCWATR